jgi:glycosyltransferase involved in cell wall biosynthesis
MDNNSLVSIIMNCYNSEKYLKEAIDSIYSQTYKNWEIIFWDNASTDNSSIIANSYDNRVKYYLALETVSLGKARNFALEKVSGDYIAFLDCDDVYSPDKLQKQVKLMHSKNYAMCYGSVININEKGEEIKRNIVKNKSGNIFSNLLMHYEINMQTVMLRRGFVVNNELNFNDGLSYCPDYNLFMTIASKADVGVIIDVIAKYRIVSNSLSKKTINIAGSEVKFTLDELLENSPTLQKKFPKGFFHAYKKARYYEIIKNIVKGNRYYAIYLLRSMFFVRYEYSITMILLIIHVPLKMVLKILNR